MTSPRTILEARARALAKPLATGEASLGDDALPILVFLSGGERMALPVDAVAAIARVTTVTPLPRATDPVFGVMAWRGRPLTVLSVGARPSEDARSRVIVLGDDRRANAGVLVDDLDDIAIVSRTALLPSSGPRAATSLGVTDDAVLVLDADALIRAADAAP